MTKRRWGKGKEQEEVGERGRGRGKGVRRKGLEGGIRKKKKG